MADENYKGPDQRKDYRRKGPDRREEVRFELENEDRRKNTGRRQDDRDAWTYKSDD